MLDDPNKNHKNEPLERVLLETIWQANLQDLQNYFLSANARKDCWFYSLLKTEAPPIRISPTNHIHEGRHCVMAARLRGETFIFAYRSTN